MSRQGKCNRLCLSTFSRRPSGFTDAVCAALKRHGTPGLFESLGQWLARFVHELNEYLPVKVEYVEAAGFSLCHVESMAVIVTTTPPKWNCKVKHHAAVCKTQALICWQLFAVFLFIVRVRRVLFASRDLWKWCHTESDKGSYCRRPYLTEVREISPLKLTAGWWQSDRWPNWRDHDGGLPKRSAWDRGRAVVPICSYPQSIAVLSLFVFFALSVGIFERGRKQNHIESSKHETGLPVFLSVFLSFFNHTVLVVLCQVRKALDSEFGQAVAVANLVRPQWFSSLQSWQAVDHKLRFSGAHYCNRKIHSCDAWTYKTIVKTCKNRQKCQTAHYTLILVGWKSMKPFGSRKWQRPLCLQSRYPKWWSG